MRGLTLRLVVILAVATLVGLVAADVAFLFWAERRFAAETRLTLRAAALAVAADPELSRDARVVLARVAAEHDAELTLVGADGSSLSTGAAPPPAAGGPGEAGAYAYAVADVRAEPWRYVEATRPRATALAATFAVAPWALVVLTLSGALSVALAALFLRRAVLVPLGRMTDLVRRQELDALCAFAAGDPHDDLAGLGRAIIAMRQTIDEDRARIAAQLEELGRKNRELADAQHQLLRAERLAVVGQLAAGLAHEVGNPLTVLSGFIDMLRDGCLGEGERREALGRMQRELERIHATLRGLLDFSRAPSGDGRPGDLAEVLGHVRALIAPQLRGVTLELPAPGGALLVAVSADGLTQLLLNLLLNALDAAGKHGRVALVVARQAAGGVTLHVDDSGPGIPVALRARVFEPFYTTKPAGKGTGLGLAMCERIVAAAGGDIQVEDSPLGGARFTVSLPAAGAHAQ